MYSSRGKIMVLRALENEENKTKFRQRFKEMSSEMAVGARKPKDPSSLKTCENISSEDEEPFPGSDSDEFVPDSDSSDSSESEVEKTVKRSPSKKTLIEDSEPYTDVGGNYFEIDQISDHENTNGVDAFEIKDKAINSNIEEIERRNSTEEQLHTVNDTNNNNDEVVENPEEKSTKTSKEKKKCRKRLQSQDEWKRKKAAIAREKGLPYINQKGQQIQGKTVNLVCLCTEKCPKKCSENVSIENRNKLFSTYYKLDVNCKNVFLFKCMSMKSPSRPQKNATKHRSSTFRYTITVENNTVSVCKKAFCSIFQIGKKKVEHIQESIKKGLSAPPQDARGKHNTRPHKLADDVLNYITNHISSFPSELSHYSRNNNPYRQYLSPQLNISKMFRLYKEKCVEENMEAKFSVKYSTYAKIFETKFNLSFRQPRSDTCSTCDSGNNSEEHKDNYESAFAQQREDRALSKSSDDVYYLTIDLQQTLPLPRLTTSKAFYLRQMWFYNLGVHLINKKGERANFFTWTEDMANRGSMEVCSALLTFIEHNREMQNGESKLIIWTDSCAGQNKNFQMICLYQYLILKGLVKSVDHKFPEVGHSFLDSDRDFGRIEKNLRRHENVYIPEEYRDIISKSAKINHVTDMSAHFRKFDELPSKLNLINRKKNVLNETVPFRDGIKWIRINEYGSYLYKETYDPHTPFKKVNLIRNHRVGNPDPADVELPRMEQKYGDLSNEKIENLKTQLKFVKAQYQWFYQQIIREHEAKRN